MFGLRIKVASHGLCNHELQSPVSSCALAAFHCRRLDSLVTKFRYHENINPLGRMWLMWTLQKTRYIDFVSVRLGHWDTRLSNLGPVKSSRWHKESPLTGAPVNFVNVETRIDAKHLYRLYPGDSCRLQDRDKMKQMKQEQNEQSNEGSVGASLGGRRPGLFCMTLLRPHRPRWFFWHFCCHLVVLCCCFFYVAQLFQSWWALEHVFGRTSGPKGWSHGSPLPFDLMSFTLSSLHQFWDQFVPLIGADRETIHFEMKAHKWWVLSSVLWRTPSCHSACEECKGAFWMAHSNGSGDNFFCK